MRLWLGGLSAAGVVLAHSLAFLVTTPDHGERSQLLHATGHRYWPHFAALALGALVAGLLGFVADRVWGDGAERRLSTRRLYAFTAPRLLLLHLVGFLYLEAGERLAVHGSFEGLLQEPVVVIGLLVQAVVALVAGFLLVLFARVVDHLVSLLRRSVRPPKMELPRGPLGFSRPRLRLAGAGPIPRGPPVLR